MQHEPRILFKSGVEEYFVATISGESVLQAGLRQQVPLNYHCASGSCGSCKATLVQGNLNVYVNGNCTQVSQPAALASDGQQVHLCQSHAASDCVFDVDYDRSVAPVALATPNHYSALLNDVQPIGAGLFRVLVDLDEDLSFLPGQYVMLEFQTPSDTRARAYSLAGFGDNKRKLEFVLTCNPKGMMSPLLCTKDSIGLPLRAYGPLGKAYIHPRDGKDVVLLVGGSGVSVAMSALEWAISTNYIAQRRLTIFWGVRDMSATYLLDVMNRCIADYPNVRVVVCSDSLLDADVEFECKNLEFFAGYPVDHAVEDARVNWEDADVYISGPAAMVDHTVRQLLIHTEVDPGDIKCDSFV